MTQNPWQEISIDDIGGSTVIYYWRRIDEKTQESITSNHPDFQAWLAEGNTPLPADPVDPWIAIREKRDQLIAASDWTMIPGATVDQAAWAAYRQVLRDLPQTYAATGPESVVWPTEPSTAGPNTTELE